MSLRELADSIKQVGVLQPLGVVSREESNDEYDLAFGERRLRAAKIAGLNSIPILLFSPDQREHIQAIENLQREDLSPIEEAELYGRLAAEHKWSQAQLGRFVGKNRTTVNKILRINDLPAKIKKEAAGSPVSKEVLIQVATADSSKQLSLWNAVRHGCYRGSRIQTAAWAEMTSYNRRRGTWSELVDLYIASSAFSRDKLLAADLPADRIHIRPNSVPDPGDPGPPGRGAVFVGRLSPEKGVRVLLEAWRELAGYPLTILGGGPEEAELRRIGASIPGVRFLGECSREGVYTALREAAFAVVPSIWYEIYPVAVAEALAWGRPVVVSHPTSLSEIVEHGHNGLPFEVGNPADLARACRVLISDSELLHEMGRAARGYYEDHLSPEVSVENLVGLYEDAIRLHRERRR